MTERSAGHSSHEETRRPHGREDAFFRSLKDEKNPMVRRQAENLRAQIAAIAARHGANARDVWNDDVKARMSVDELDQVNALFARIRTLADKKLSRVDAREMTEEVERREAEAREMLDGVKLRLLRSVRVNPRECGAILGPIVEQMLQSGLAGLAAEILDDTLIVTLSDSIYARLEVAAARLVGSTDFERAQVLLLGAEEKIPAMTNGFRHFSEIYGTRVAILSDSGIRKEAEHIETMKERAYKMIAFALLELEMARRGMGRLSNRAEKFRSRTIDALNGPRPDEHIYFKTVILEAQHAAGADVRAQLLALADGLQRSSWVKNDLMQRLSLISSIADTAGRVGAIDVIKTLQEETWWRENPKSGFSPSPMSLWNVALEGCLESGTTENAIGIMRAMKGIAPADAQRYGLQLVKRLLNEGDIAGAVIMEESFFGTASLDGLRLTPEYLAACARRGDNVLGLARREADRRAAFRETSMLYLAMTAIATLGYAKETRKQLDEYAKR